MQDFDTGCFTEANSADIVAGRNAACKDARLKEVMDALIRHLHAAVKEIKPTRDEWMQAVEFLTATGHKCDSRRQEFILLSDVLGVSMLVDAINAGRPAGASENTVLGPFHVDGAPQYEHGHNICLDHKGEDLVVRGRVLDLAGNAVAGAKVDVWQANDDGFYDVQQKGVQPDFNLRGVFTTDEQGGFWFRSVKPKCYSIPHDGPVGAMLKRLGRHPNRPAHLHFIISCDDYDTLTTHLFDPDDPYLHSDAVFGVKESLIADFQKIDDPQQAKALGFDGAYWEVEFNFVLAPA